LVYRVFVFGVLAEPGVTPKKRKVKRLNKTKCRMRAQPFYKHHIVKNWKNFLEQRFTAPKKPNAVVKRYRRPSRYCVIFMAFLSQ